MKTYSQTVEEGIKRTTDVFFLHSKLIYGTLISSFDDIVVDVSVTDFFVNHFKILSRKLLEGEIELITSKIVDVGEGTYCKSCGQHIAAGDCNCSGKNEALEDHKAYLLSELANIK